MFGFVWLVLVFWHSHVDDLVYTDMLLSERAHEIPYLLLTKSGRKLNRNIQKFEKIFSFPNNLLRIL